MNVNELRDQLDDHTAELGTEAADEEIGDTYDGHAALLWEDGEVTTTKNGDLFGARSLHQSLQPFMPGDETLWDHSPKNPFTSDYCCRVILDREAVNELLLEYIEAHDLHPRGKHML